MRASTASSARVVAGVQARDADHRIDLVERAVGVDAQIVFLAPLAGAERGRAVVAGARIDAVEDDHRCLSAAHHPDRQHDDDDRDELEQHAQRMSFCDSCGEPPRIMLMRPSSRMIATIMIATGTATWDMKLAIAGTFTIRRGAKPWCA